MLAIVASSRGFSAGVLHRAERGDLRRPDALLGGSGRRPTGAASLGDYAERTYRLVALLIDREYGLLRWAPVFALAFVGVWFLYASGAPALARVIPELREEEEAGAVRARRRPSSSRPRSSRPRFRLLVPGRHLVAVLPLLSRWSRSVCGARRAWGSRSLSQISVVASVWLWLDVCAWAAAAW